MSFTASFSFEAATGLTLKAALVSANVVDAAFRDITATFYDDGGGGWQFLGSFPDGARGTLFFYVGAIGAENDWPTARAALKAANGDVDAVQCLASLNPEEFENVDVKLSALDTTAAVAAVQAYLDNLSRTGTKLWVLDSNGNSLATGGGSSGPTLSEIRAAITTDHGDGSYLRNTEPTDAPTLAEILDGITAAHGTGSYIPDSGSGANAVIVTATDGTDPLENVLVTITDPNGDNPRTRRTDASGATEPFGLDAATYSILLTKNGYDFTPTALVVTDDLDIAYAMTAITLPVSSDPLLCLLSGTFIRTDGSPAAGVQIIATLYSSDRSTSTTGGQGIVMGPITITLDEDGEVPAETTLVRTDEFTLAGCRWQFTCIEMRLSESSVELAASGFDLTTLLD